MAGEHVVVGMDFELTCSVLPLTGVQAYENHRIYYRKPNGANGYVSPTSASGSDVIGRITSVLNPLNGRAGTWEFYVYMTSGALIFRSKKSRLIVNPLGFG